jgi:hypothetical protein
VLDGDSMLELHNNWAFHHENTLAYFNTAQDGVWERCPQKHHNDFWWNDLNVNDKDTIIVKEMSFLDVMLAYARTVI